MHFKIHNEGWIYFIISILITIIFFPFFPLIGFLFLLISFYIYYFFRDPLRSIPHENLLLSPADGIITYIGISKPPIDLKQIKGNFIKISIFLNIFNVHVNRMPTSGVVKNIKYIPGKFINAKLDKSSADNERNIITLENEDKDLIIVTQIAGLIARRIICDIKEKQKVLKGTRFGIIKFGSRVDLYIPSSYKPLVTLGQIVTGGETIISNPKNISEITKCVRN